MVENLVIVFEKGSVNLVKQANQISVGEIHVDINELPFILEISQGKFSVDKHEITFPLYISESSECCFDDIDVIRSISNGSVMISENDFKIKNCYLMYDGNKKREISFI